MKTSIKNYLVLPWRNCARMNVTRIIIRFNIIRGIVTRQVPKLICTHVRRQKCSNALEQLVTMLPVAILFSTLRPVVRTWLNSFKKKLDSGPNLVQLGQMTTLDKDDDANELPRKICCTIPRTGPNLGPVLAEYARMLQRGGMHQKIGARPVFVITY